MNPIRPATLGVAAVLSAMPAGDAPAAAAAPAAATVWTLSLDGGEKQCRLTLRPESGRPRRIRGHAAGMPSRLSGPQRRDDLVGVRRRTASR